MNEDMQKGWHSHKTFKNKIVYVFFFAIDP